MVMKGGEEIKKYNKNSIYKIFPQKILGREENEKSWLVDFSYSFSTI